MYFALILKNIFRLFNTQMIKKKKIYMLERLNISYNHYQITFKNPFYDDSKNHF